MSIINLTGNTAVFMVRGESMTLSSTKKLVLIYTETLNTIDGIPAVSVSLSFTPEIQQDTYYLVTEKVFYFARRPDFICSSPQHYLTSSTKEVLAAMAVLCSN